MCYGCYGSFDGAEVCELVGLFILNELSITFGKDRVGLYRDDGLILLKGTRGRLADQTRKKLHHLFEQFDLIKDHGRGQSSNC